MELLRKSLIAVVLLLIVILAWVSTTIYFEGSNVDVNPNAETYTKQLKTAFETEYLEDVTTRTETSFSISPSEFLNLTKTTD